jgi:hypothetical protein
MELIFFQYRADILFSESNITSGISLVFSLS